MGLPPGCYGRIAPRSSLALKKLIDVGARVVDSDYRGEIGVILFNFGNQDFIVNMGDRIAQLIFEKINTPVIKETNDLEGIRPGEKGYGSTGSSAEIEINPVDKVRTTESVQIKAGQSVTKISEIRAAQDSKISKILINEPIPHTKKRSQTAEVRRIMSACQMQKFN